MSKDKDIIAMTGNKSGGGNTVALDTTRDSNAHNFSKMSSSAAAAVENTNSNTDNPTVLKYVSLVLLTLQNALLILVMRYVRTRDGDMFMAATAVVMTELFKALTSLACIYVEEGRSVNRLLAVLHRDIILQPLDCVKVSVPSLVYTLQNNLLYVALSNLEAATFQVTYQLKILTTALFSVFMLNKELSKLQWLSLLILFVGVSVVQLEGVDDKHSETSVEQNQMLGLAAVIVSCMMSGFAGVYFEKILKGTRQSVWLRNLQLGSLGVVIGLITVMISNGADVREKGFFYGYDWLVWFVVCLQSFGGLMVAVVVKYADNILKGFATSAAIIISTVASIYFFSFSPSFMFYFGGFLVLLAVYMYSKFVVKPVKSKDNSSEKKTLQTA